MNHKEFNALVRDTHREEKEMIVTKAGEYASDAERFSNFIHGAEFMASGRTPEAACWNWMAKHLVATLDAIDALAVGAVKPLEFWEEKLGDVRVYALILEGIIKDRLNKKE